MERYRVQKKIIHYTLGDEQTRGTILLRRLKMLVFVLGEKTPSAGLLKRRLEEGPVVKHVFGGGETGSVFSSSSFNQNFKCFLRRV